MGKFALLSLFLVTVLFIGCPDSNSNLAEVAERFIKTYYKGDPDTCNSPLEKEKLTLSKDMSEIEKEAFKEMRRNLDEMKYVVVPDNENNVVEEDYYETTLTITSKEDADLKDKFNVSVEEGDDNKWRVTDFDINWPVLWFLY